MKIFLLNLLISLLTSKATEDLISQGVSKLVKSRDSGIGKDLANTLINGIVGSKLNKADEASVERVKRVLS